MSVTVPRAAFVPSVTLLARPPDKPFSMFERWPGWLFYAPIVAQWLWRGVRAGDLSLPTAANPAIETGGLCGESKSAILDLVAAPSRSLIAPYATFVTGDDDLAAVARVRASTGISWPLVLKPDIGCNGTGVRLIQDPAHLAPAVAAFPRGVRLVVQEFIPDPGEAGLFYIRHPHEAAGRITSLTLKAPPTIVGNGRSTIRELIEAHPRAGRTVNLFLDRLASRLGEKPPQGLVIPLVFTGNHCKGSIFKDGAALNSPSLTRAIDAFARDIPDFHFGRIDVRYRSEEALRSGTGFTVIEVNGVGSEATHIWDPTFTIAEAYRVQFAHYAAAWNIGAAMRQRGHRPSGLGPMYRAWRRQRRLMASYPRND
jgi:hypothetical protein